jgi:uncharacterized RDD family membrane protein YckC
MLNAINMATPHPADLAETEITVVYAGFWLRLAATLVDMIVIYMPFGFAFFLIMIGTKFVNARKGYDPAIMFLLAAPAVFIAGTWLYFAVMESSAWQATLGKKLLGLYVTDLNRQRLTLARATGRTLAKYLSVMTAGVGYLLCGVTERKQALHDVVAKCLVLRRRRRQFTSIPG